MKLWQVGRGSCDVEEKPELKAMFMEIRKGPRRILGHLDSGGKSVMGSRGSGDRVFSQTLRILPTY